MKVLHVPFTFAPDPVGGTEVYVEHLAHRQQRAGLDVVIAAPTQGPDASYDHAGLPVHRYRTVPSLVDLYGDGDTVAADGFGRVLDDVRPDLVHLHAFTSGVSVRVARLVTERGVPLVFTYHTPTVSCPRGTLLRWGREECDGALDVARCTACVLNRHGVPALLGRTAAAVSGRLGPAVEALGLSGGAWTGLRMAPLVDRRHRAVRSLLGLAARCIALCDWTWRLLVRAGCPREKLRLIRHGLPVEGPPLPTAPRPPAPPLRVAFLGRLAPEKGAELLVEAVRRAGPDVLLDIHGVGELAARRRVDALAGGSGRVRYLTPLPHASVVPALGGYHVVAVPSRWLETGPLVVLEAFAAGTPVLASRLGGLRELVTDGVNGLLLPPHEPGAWSAALARLAGSPRLLADLTAGVTPPASFDTVARGVAEVYAELSPR